VSADGVVHAHPDEGLADDHRAQEHRHVLTERQQLRVGRRLREHAARMEGQDDAA
jgi:hypothetical protein